MQSEAEVKERSANMKAKKPVAKLSYNIEAQETLGVGRYFLAVSIH